MPPKKNPTPPADAAPSDDAVRSLTRAAQSLSETAAQMMQMIKILAETRDLRGPGETAGGGTGGVGPAAAAAQVRTYEDDPFSEADATADPTQADPVVVPAPANGHTLLQTQIAEPRPTPGLYGPDTPQFRYWTAAEALARGINFWAPLLPPQTRWTTAGLPMRVTLVTGTDLNANYTRMFGLRFYEQSVGAFDVFSGESPDVVCHELGHAILDAVRPELFDAASLEVAAFHESFGDMSAILSALQLPSLRQKVLDETQGRLNVNSRLSRLAEQLGWAIRQLSPTAVDRDCLRNAANRFFYRDPVDLPPSAPASQLSSEAHSFSRLFTGAFLDALARMLTVAGQANSATLLAVSRDLGQLLVDAVRLAAVTPGYYSQVAAAMVQADQARSGGRYRSALSSSFVEHGILAPSAAAALATAPVLHAAAAPALAASAAGSIPLTTGEPDNEGYKQGAHDAAALPTSPVPTDLGVPIEAHIPAESPRRAAASAAQGVGQTVARSPVEDARAFIEDLIQLGRVDMDPARGMVPAELTRPDRRESSRKTHTLVTTPDGKLLLKRLHFNCGLAACGCHGERDASWDQAAAGTRMNTGRPPRPVARPTPE